jgi:hypothetical protein
MWLRRRAALFLLALAALSVSACQRGIFREYEYEEEIYLKLDGSATVIVNTSIPALVALRGAPLEARPDATVDRTAIRRYFESPALTVSRVSRPWRRSGRRFVQVRIETDDIRTLAKAAPFAWSRYRLASRNGQIVYEQELGAASAAPPPQTNWTGRELVAVRMHVPSRIQYHNAPTRQVERGNILSWEQPLRDRLAGKPLALEVRMESESILAKTLTIFGLSATAAFTLLAAIVWWVRRSGRVAA